MSSTEPSPANDPCEVEITHLQHLDLQALRARWRALIGKAAPAHLPRHLLLRMVAYRLQADRYGDLSAASAKMLARLSAGDVKVAPVEASTQPGTVFVREWEGTVHRVMALQSGYAWNETTYRSLSEVARAITGTRWSGPRFFGLTDPRP